jgi:hypothetical protein
MPRTAGRLHLLTVLEFVRSHDPAHVTGVPLDEVGISGVEAWPLRP